MAERCCICGHGRRQATVWGGRTRLCEQCRHWLEDTIGLKPTDMVGRQTAVWFVRVLAAFAANQEGDRVRRDERARRKAAKNG